MRIKIGNANPLLPKASLTIKALSFQLRTGWFCGQLYAQYWAFCANYRRWSIMLTWAHNTPTHATRLKGHQ